MAIVSLNLYQKILRFRHTQFVFLGYTMSKLKRMVTMMKYDKLLGIGMVGFLGLFMALLV